MAVGVIVSRELNGMVSPIHSLTFSMHLRNAFERLMVRGADWSRNGSETEIVILDCDIAGGGGESIYCCRRFWSPLVSGIVSCRKVAYGSRVKAGMWRGILLK